jgi:hypothetical protein
MLDFIYDACVPMDGVHLIDAGLFGQDILDSVVYMVLEITRSIHSV